jgi:hypothetical protein
LSLPKIQRLKYIKPSVTSQKHLTSADIFENELFITTAVQQGQHVDAVGCRTFCFTWLISMFDFDLMQIPTGYIALSCTHTRPGYKPGTLGFGFHLLHLLTVACDRRLSHCNLRNREM